MSNNTKKDAVYVEILQKRCFFCYAKMTKNARRMYDG